MKKEQSNRRLAVVAGSLTLVLLVVSIIWFGLTDVSTRCTLVGGSAQSALSCDQSSFFNGIPSFLDGGVPHCANVSVSACYLLGGSIGGLMVKEIGQGTVCKIPCP